MNDAKAALRSKTIIYSYIYSYIFILSLSIFQGQITFLYQYIFNSDLNYTWSDIPNLGPFEIEFITLPFIIDFYPIIAVFHYPIIILGLIILGSLFFGLHKLKIENNNRKTILLTILFVFWHLFGLYSFVKLASAY